MSSNLFEITDYNGYQVHCTKSQWYGHIVTRHPELKNNIEAVKDAIHNPDVVHESNQKEDCTVSFKSRSAHLTSYRNCIVKVVVNYTKENDEKVGEVSTVHLVKTVKGGIGDEIYRKPQD